MRRLLRRRVPDFPYVRGGLEVDAPVTVSHCSHRHNAETETRSLSLVAHVTHSLRYELKVRDPDELIAGLQSGRRWLSGEEGGDCPAEVAPDRVELVHELMTAAKIAVFGEAGPCAYDQDLSDQLTAALARAGTHAGARR